MQASISLNHIAASAGALGTVALVVANVVTRHLDHDENQFIASAYLTVRQGLIPYKDYPFFHTPYLIFVDAAVFSITSHLLLAARLVCVACGFGTLLIIVRQAMRAATRVIRRRMLVTCTSILFLMNPLFTHTSGRAWNHDFPLFATLCGFVALIHARTVRASALWLAMTGGCIGIAVGTRITFLPVLAAIVAIIWVDPHWNLQRARAWMCIIVGFAAAMGPCIGLFLHAPGQFLFGNFRYPFFNLMWRRACGEISDYGVAGHLAFIAKHILNQTGNAVTVILFISACVPLVRYRNWQNHPEWLAACFFTLGLLPGAIIPTPSFFPYFYAPMPFMLLTAIYAAVHASDFRQSQWRVAFLVAAAGSVPGGALVYAHAFNAAIFSEWTTTTIHRNGRCIADSSGGRPVLTLAPAVTAEGGLPLYPQFSTGSFAFRVAPFVPKEQAQHNMLPAAVDLERDLASQPPASVVISAEGKLDAPLRLYAFRHHLPLWELDKDGKLLSP